jgi:hypothetical protein
MKKYPSLSNFIDYCASADIEDRKLARPGLLMEACRLALRINPRLGGHYLTRATALASFSYEVTPADKAAGNAALEAAQRLSDIISMLLKKHVQTPFYGSTLYRLVSANTTQGNVLSIAKIEEPGRYNYDLENVYMIDKNGTMQTAEPIARNVAMLLDTEDFFDERGGILRRVMPTEILRYDARLENANFLRKLKGIFQIISKNAGEEEQAAAETAARTAIQNNYLVTSEMIEFKLNQLAATGSGDAFTSFIEQANNDIAIACLGQANTSELPTSGGSRAALQVMRLISADVMYSDMIRVENLVNRLLHYDYMLNHAANAAPTEVPYKFYFKLSEEQDPETAANALETLMRSGIPLIREEVYRRIGYTMPLQGDETMTITQQLI